MANIDNEKFNELLSQGKIDEAKQLLNDFINSEWTKEDEGEHYVNLITEYIEMSTTINQAYLYNILQLKKSLEQLDKIEDETKRGSELSRIRDEITKL